ncbi:MAG: hypothetical protein PVJ92_00545, partial [Candidatus Dependentiae bacterium]
MKYTRLITLLILLSYTPLILGDGLASLAGDTPSTLDTPDDLSKGDGSSTSDDDNGTQEHDSGTEGTYEEEIKPLNILPEEEEIITLDDIDMPALPGEETAEDIAAIELTKEEKAAIKAKTKDTVTAPLADQQKIELAPSEAKLVTDADWNIEQSLQKLQEKTGAGADLQTEEERDQAAAAAAKAPTTQKAPAASPEAATTETPAENVDANQPPLLPHEVPTEEFSAEFEVVPTPDGDLTPPPSPTDYEFLAEQEAKRTAVKPAGPAFTPEQASISEETIDLSDDLEAMLAEAEAQAATMPTPEESAAAKAGDKTQRKKNKAEQTEAMRLVAEAAEEAKKAYIMQLKGLREAGVDIDANGIAFTSKLQLWDKVYARMTGALNTRGLLMQGYVPRLALGPLELTGAGPDGKYGTDDDGLTVEARIEKGLARVMASGMVDLVLAKARGDVLFGTSGVTIFTLIKVLGIEVKFLAEGSGKGKNFDFVVQGAADADLIRILEEEISKAMEFLTSTTQDGLKKTQDAVKYLRKQVKAVRQTSTDLSKKFKRAKKRLDKKTKHVDMILGPPRRLVQKTTNEMEKVKRATWKVRRAMVKGRRKMVRGLRKAFDKVLRTKKSKENARKKYRRAKKRAKWYRPWVYVEVAFWAASLAIVTAVHAVAESVYIAIKSAINTIPIDAVPPLPAMWVAYAAAKVACFSAIQALTAARLAANPLATKEMFEMVGIAIAIAHVEYAVAALSIRLELAIRAFDVAHAAVSIGGEFAKAATEIGALALNFVPIMIYGAGFKFSLRELGEGKLPMVGLIARVFGKRKILKAQIDFTKPQTLITALPKMLLQIVLPGSDDFIKKMDSINMKHAGKLEALEKQKKAVKQTEEKWKEKKQRSLEAKERIIEQGKKEAGLIEANAMKQGEGEYGKELDLSSVESKGMGGNSSDDFDPKNPGSYSCEGRNFAFRWNEHWMLPTKNSGAVTFFCSGPNEIIIGLNASPKAKSLSRIYEIIIGFDGNKGTVIRKLDAKGVPIKLVESRDSIARNKSKGDDDYKAYPYWISYHEGYIACGHGTKPGENLIVEWLDEDAPEKIKVFAFSCMQSRLSFSEIAATKAFHRVFGSRYSIYEEMNNFVWRDEWKLPESGNGTITFKAKANRDIKIGLSDDTSTKHADYIADIGMDGNTRSSLVEVSPDGKKYNRKALSEDPDILVKGNNKEYAEYWVTHNKGHLAYGTGSNPRDNIALEWVDRTPLAGLTHFSFSSWDNPVEIRDIKVQPAVEIPVGSRYSAVNRKGSFEWRPEWQLFEKDKAVIRFRTKGKESLIMGLHTGMGEPNESTFKLTIGGKKNT